MSKAATKAKRRAGRPRKTEITGMNTPWDHGAMGAANRHGLIVEERGEISPTTGKVTNPNNVTGVRRRDILEFWHTRGTLSTAGYNASVKLRDAFEGTMRGKPALPENDRVQSSPKPDHAVTIQIDRINQFTRYMGLVQAQDRAIISACVLEGHHPSSVYGALCVKEGLAHLRDATDRLANALDANPKSR